MCFGPETVPRPHFTRPWSATSFDRPLLRPLARGAQLALTPGSCLRILSPSCTAFPCGYARAPSISCRDTWFLWYAIYHGRPAIARETRRRGSARVSVRKVGNVQMSFRARPPMADARRNLAQSRDRGQIPRRGVHPEQRRRASRNDTLPTQVTLTRQHHLQRFFPRRHCTAKPKHKSNSDGAGPGRLDPRLTRQSPDFPADFTRRQH